MGKKREHRCNLPGVVAVDDAIWVDARRSSSWEDNADAEEVDGVGWRMSVIMVDEVWLIVSRSRISS